MYVKNNESRFISNQVRVICYFTYQWQFPNSVRKGDAK